MFIYFNPNPKGRVTDDCVVRAICKLTGMSWRDVYYDLCDEGAEVGEWGNRNFVWGRYLTRIGYEPFLLPNTCPDCFTVKDFCRLYSKGTYLLATGNHAVTVVDGDYYDAWDSGDDVPIYFWKAKGA